MKYNSKEMKDNSKGMTVWPLPIEGEVSDMRVTALRCSNLRRNRRGKYLVAAGRPARNAKLTTLPLLTLHGGTEGRICIVREGNRLRTVYLDSDKAGYDIGGVTGTVRCAVAVSTKSVVVMTDDDRYMLVQGADGRWSVRREAGYPVLRFEAADVMRLSADAEERELTGTYDTHSTTLCDADADRLSKDLLRCYAELADKTTRGGMELQPVLARYRLEGSGGEVLYRSPVVAVGAPSGVQGVDELRCMLSDDRRQRGRLRVSADVYKLRLRQVSESDIEPGRVKRLVVETSLPVHPADGGVTAANALERSGTNGVALRCFVPGASVTMVPARGYMAQRLRGLAMKGDAAFREAAVVHNPFDSGSALDIEVRVMRRGVQGVDDENAAVAAVLARKADATDRRVALCMVPNRFTAESGCVAGDNAVWGGITAKGFRGYRAEELVSEVTPETETHQWRCVVVTEMASGVKRVTTSWGTHSAPLRFSPALCSPRPDAVKMTILLERDGAVYKGEFPLSPDESRRAAYYFSPDCRGIELAATDEAFGYVSDGVENETMPSALIVAGRGNPADGVAVAEAGCGNVTAMLAVDRRGSAWEFGHRRVYAMTDDGIFLLSIGAGISSLRCDRLDRRCVTNRGAVAETDDDKYPAVCIASSDLIGLSRGNITTLERGIADIAAGWDRRDRELWLAGADGRIRIKDSLDGGWREAGGLSATGFHDSGRGLLVDSDLGIRDTAAGASEMVEFAYRLRCDMPALEWYRAGMKVYRAGAELRSRNINGAMRVVSRTIAEDARSESAIEFRGAVNSPLLIGACAMRDSVVEVEISGEMAAGSRVERVVLNFEC